MLRGASQSHRNICCIVWLVGYRCLGGGYCLHLYNLCHEVARRTIFRMPLDTTYVIKKSRIFVINSRGVKCRCAFSERCRLVATAGDRQSRGDL